jgi:hypothetical protein
MLLRKMSLSLAMTGVLVGLSIVIAVMTYRHIVWPLERLEKVVSTVRETKNYASSRNRVGDFLIDFDHQQLLLPLPLLLLLLLCACGQRACVVHHVHSEAVHACA